jgi:hypothetical protein
MSLTARLCLIAVTSRVDHVQGAAMAKPSKGIALAGLAKLVDALDSDSSVRKDFRVQVPGSA